jgi:hypothetical protein
MQASILACASFLLQLPVTYYHSFEVLGSLASSPAPEFIATVPPEQLHLQGFFCGYNDVDLYQ